MKTALRTVPSCLVAGLIAGIAALLSAERTAEAESWQQWDYPTPPFGVYTPTIALPGTTVARTTLANYWAPCTVGGANELFTLPSSTTRTPMATSTSTSGSPASLDGRLKVRASGAGNVWFVSTDSTPELNTFWEINPIIP
jgi:hypothetical protein